MPIANNNKMILYGGIGLAVLVVIIIAVMMMKKEKYVGVAPFGTAPLQNGGLMLESDVNGNLSTSATLPIGAIIMWSGPQASIPVGWALCDGSNNKTPDMRGLFTIGASVDSDLKVGGVDNNTVSLIPENVPLWMTCSGTACDEDIGLPITSGKGYAFTFDDKSNPGQWGPILPGSTTAVNAKYMHTYTYDSSGNIRKNPGGGVVTGQGFSIAPRNIGVYYIMKMQ